jgi:hypothetical protein
MTEPGGWYFGVVLILRCTGSQRPNFNWSHRRRGQRSGTDPRGRRRSGARSPVGPKVACRGRSDSTGRDQARSAPDRSMSTAMQREKAQRRWRCSPQRIGKTLRHQWDRRRRKRASLGVHRAPPSQEVTPNSHDVLLSRSSAVRWKRLKGRRPSRKGQLFSIQIGCIFPSETGDRMRRARCGTSCGWLACAAAVGDLRPEDSTGPAFLGYWHWKSRPQGGRPQIDTELRVLIPRISVENPLWGAPVPTANQAQAYW